MGPGPRFGNGGRFVEDYRDRCLQVNREGSFREKGDFRKYFVSHTFQLDFKKSAENCKPTVHQNLLEFYFKFMSKYGHAD